MIDGGKGSFVPIGKEVMDKLRSGEDVDNLPIFMEGDAVEANGSTFTILRARGKRMVLELQAKA